MMRTMKKSAFAVLALIALVGCKKDPTIAGKWKTSMDQGGTKGDVIADFGDDGKVTMNVTMSPQPNMTLGMKFTGTWTKEDASTYDMKLSDVTLDDSKLSGPAKTLVSQGFASQKAQIIEQANKDSKMKIVWDGNDKFSAARGTKGETMVFERVK